MKKNLLLLNILILSVLTIFAQNGFTTYPFVPSVTNYRTALKIDVSGNKWITTANRGVYKFDGTNWTTYDTLNSGISTNGVYDIAFGTSNVIWFATIKGLSKFDGSTWTTYNTTNSGLPNDTVLCIYANNTDTWIGTRNGLAKFNGSNWIVYNTSNSGLVNNRVTCINKDLSGDFWIGTLTGLCVKSATSWIVYNENNSNMVRDQVNAIYIDNNVKWIGTQNSGLFKFDNGSFIPLESLFFNIPINTVPYPSNIQSISKGPQGGVLINAFYEILPNQIHKYTLPSGVGYTFHFHSFDSSTGLVWSIKNTGAGSFNVIYSFNYQNYIGNTLLPEAPEDYKTLDVNEIRAGLLNRGDMFWDIYGSQRARYEVPKYSGKNANFASALWIGGFDNGGVLHQAAMTYRQSGVDYWPGPLDTLSGATDSITSASYDKIWKIDRLNIQEFQTMFANGSVQNGTYTVSNDILTWPAIGIGNYTRNMAPFVDINGDGLYKPLIDGDYPKITGDQMCYWIFNDNLISHTETNCAALKVEVHASAYAFTCAQIADSLKALNYTTLYNYDIFNRSANNYTKTYIGDWQDSDLGWYKDDYVGCNPSNNYGFEYNGTPVDGNGNLGCYGEKPPMISTVILNGPAAEPNDSIDNNNNGVIDEVGEKNLMAHFQYFNNTSDSVNGNPNATECNAFYYYLSGRWKNGSQITYGGDGTTGSVPCNFMFDGVPSGTGWDEVSLNNVPDDRRFIMSSGPFNLNAGQHVNFNYALVYTRDTATAYTITNLYNKNLADVKKVQQWYAVSNYPSCYDLQMGVDAIQKDNNSVNIYPNPANSQITIDYKGQSKNVTVEIYNITGQKIKLLVNFNSLQTINIHDFVDGLYLLKINDGNNSFTQRFIKQ